MNIIFCNKKAKPTAHNRSVSVRRLTAARLRKMPVGASPLYGILLHHSFAVAGMLRIPLLQSQNCHLPPERYTKIFYPTFLVTPRHPWRGEFTPKRVNK